MNVRPNFFFAYKVTAEHSLVDVEVEDKDVLCRTHPGELVRFYCEQCSSCICVVCAFEAPHRGHEVLSFPSALARHGHSLDTLVSSCKDRITHLRVAVEEAKRLDKEVSLAEEQVRSLYTIISRRAD